MKLLEYDPEEDDELTLPSSKPHVSVAYLKHMWKKSDSTKTKSSALDGLTKYTSTIKNYPTNPSDLKFRQEMKLLLAK